MKWFKHVSDSLDDPFIFDLITRFGGDGYMVFFGILEIYSREFKPEDKWKLNITRTQLRTKLQKRQDTLIINSLKHIKNSGKWEITINENEIIIYIPKFKELLDNWTAKQIPKTNKSLRSNNKESIQPIRIKNKEEEEDKDKKGMADAPFEIPSKEIIQESSDLMITNQIEEICRQLYTEKIFPEVNAFKNKMLKAKKNPRSVLHTLCRAYMKRTFDEGPWAYCQKIIENESQNYNARDYEKTSQKNLG